jgi:type II secretory pathway pseudopilin PulG
MIKQKGFTIVEIVVVMALIIAIMVGMFALFTSHNKIYNYETALIKATGSARTAMNEISTYALQSYRVVASQTINGTAYTSGANTVIFQIPAFDASGNAISNTYDYAAFSLSGTTLTEDLQAAASSSRKTVTKAVSKSVSALAITYDSATWTSVKKVTVDLTTSENYRGE